MTGNNPSSPFPNRFRQALVARERLVGCWCALGSPITTEIAGLSGFDWLLLDSEHGPNDVLSLVPQLMALKDSPSAPVVRPHWNDPIVLKRLLDIGFFKNTLASSGEMITGLLPINMVGSLGTLEAGWAVGYIICGVDRASAIATGFIVHGLIILCGFIISAAGFAYLLARRQKQSLAGR